MNFKIGDYVLFDQTIERSFSVMTKTPPLKGYGIITELKDTTTRAQRLNYSWLLINVLEALNEDTEEFKAIWLSNFCLSLINDEKELNRLRKIEVFQ